MNAGIAQLVEHDLAKVGVASSSLVSRSKIWKCCKAQITQAGIAQLVEHNLAKVRVASSSLVFRSEKKEAESFDSASFFCYCLPLLQDNS